jgi:hypothetical protein
MSVMAGGKSQDDMSNIPLADDDPQGRNTNTYKLKMRYFAAMKKYP